MMKRTQAQQKQKGIALVQVLLIVGIVSILLLIMVSSTRQQLNQVDQLQSQLEAHFKVYSASTELQYTLLTEVRDSSAESQSLWAQDWNFYGEAFRVNPFEVQIYNLRSMIGLSGASEPLEQLLVHHGVSQGQAAELIYNLRIWQAPSEAEQGFTGRFTSSELAAGAGLPIQHPTELLQIPGWTEELVRLISPWVNTWESFSFNTAFAPNELMHLVLSAAQSDILRQMRSEGNYNRHQFSAVTGIVDDEFSTLFHGPGYRLTISLLDPNNNDNNHRLRLNVEGEFRPYSSEPVSIRRTY